MIILDVSANTHKNDWNYLKRMLDELKAVDSGKHKIVIKHQMFEKAGDNIPLNSDIFYQAYFYAKEELGYETTTSVFDLSSIRRLVNNYNVPFIKIANNRELDYLINEIPRKIPVVASYTGEKSVYSVDHYLCCISKYPAGLEYYKKHFKPEELKKGISDHTTDWTLYKAFKPEIYEIHYKLEDSTGLDAGEFARTPKQLAEIL